jgi:ribosome-binding protein aMBF1 (putative translation factor)
MAAAIMRARTTADLTQAQLAERLKTDQGNIARLHYGDSLQRAAITIPQIG